MHWSPGLHFPTRPRAVALGAFDGLHLGHARTIQVMRSFAHRSGAEATVLTFNPSPREFEHGQRQPGRRLTPVDEQIYYLRRLGIDTVVLFEFPGRIHAVEPEEFVRDILVRQLSVVHVTGSRTHRFGRGGRGDLQMLHELGAEYGFGVETVSPVTLGGQRVSSTRIRDLLAECKVHQAGALLGRPYAICAPVVAGAGLGTNLGFPTANLRLPREKVLPGDGVYAGLSGKVRGGDYQAVEQPRPAAINVGLAPTVRGDERLVEVHLTGEQCDLRDSCIKVEFLRWLRDEEEFEDTEELSAQIGRDVERTAELAGRPMPEELLRFNDFCTSEYVIRRGDCAG
ncbi:MAG: riboflavin biosynthesis protein RibF [Armatimonadota bacterium]|nr:riboflavin biosynthesis protein RibF [Armatimonadota bacterium]